MELSPPPPLVNYVLAHMSVKTNVCTFQKHECGYKLPSRTVTDYNLIFVTRGRVAWVVAGVGNIRSTRSGLVIRSTRRRAPRI